jgi:ferric-dicitrate binding protein FerR (iron transport regulator)
MNSNDEQIRAAIAEQAGEWFVANEEGPMDARESAALAAWFRTSPVHIEEFIGVSVVARDLKEARTDPDYSLEAILIRASAEDGRPVRRLSPRVIAAVRETPSGRWFPAAAAIAMIVMLSLGLLFTWNLRPTGHPAGPPDIATLHFETRHGEQLTQRLADNSVLHLNTDSAVSVRYSKSERLVMLISGQAEFEVSHEANRAFRVHTGSADIIDIGTQFDVRVDQGSTVVTVVEGRVAVGPPISGLNHSARSIELTAHQQIRVAEGEWPAAPVAVDAERTTSWLHRQIAFDHEPLEKVAAEFNRYASKPIEIVTPGLQKLEISGVFATDDLAAFIAFLRSMEGVQVEETATRFRVSRDHR